jgi:sulfur-carrier protein adenylyltransferase/sulfurtransferase
MTAPELHAHLKQSSVAPVLLDVRESWEYRLAHLPGSTLMPMEEIASRMGELDPKRETVVICHLGVRSRYAAHWLEQQGFEAIINLDGGIDTWSLTVDPNVPRY